MVSCKHSGHNHLSARYEDAVKPEVASKQVPLGERAKIRVRVPIPVCRSVADGSDSCVRSWRWFPFVPMLVSSIRAGLAQEVSQWCATSILLAMTLAGSFSEPPAGLRWQCTGCRRSAETWREGHETPAARRENRWRHAHRHARPLPRVPARGRGGRCTRRAGGVHEPGRDPGEVRARRDHRLRPDLRRPRPNHRRHADDAVHRGGTAARVGARIAARHHQLSRGHLARLPALAGHPGRAVAGRAAPGARDGLALSAARAARSARARKHLPLGVARDAVGRGLRHQRQQGLRGRDARGARRPVPLEHPGTPLGPGHPPTGLRTGGTHPWPSDRPTQRRRAGRAHS
jgi:hypothetical protein